MTLHMTNEINKLKDKLLLLCRMVEDSLNNAVKSVRQRDQQLATQVMEGDGKIDEMEVELEEDCLKILALHQPVAIDLRFIVTALKINNDLERIGDLAVNIAERARFLSSHPEVEIPSIFDEMAEKTKDMLNKSLDSLINTDCGTAYQVCIADDEVDILNGRMYKYVNENILADPSNIEALIHLLSGARHLERIADLATNIAEDTIYMVEGKIIRHQTEDYSS